MSRLGDAIRDNADLHHAIYEILGTLAGVHITGHDIGISHYQELCAAATRCLPHMPVPDRANEHSES